MKYTFLILLILISFFVKSQNDTLKISRNRFMLDFGIDYNLSNQPNYCNIDTNVLKEIIDPSSSMLYKEKSNYFTFHIGSIYNYQFRCNGQKGGCF